MKRDLDLIRLILMELESEPTGRYGRLPEIDGYEPGAVGYHVKLLVDAQLVEGFDVSSTDTPGPMWYPTMLTWDGHDFLDAARDEGLWKRVRTAIGERCSTTAFEVVKSVLVKYASAEIQRQLGIGP